jgi:hypothetical protein
MSGLQNLSLEQAAVLIASRVRVKQAGLFNKAIPDADITETMVHEPGGKHFWGGVEQYAEPRLLPRLIGGDANARFNSTADLVNKHYDQVITPEHVDALRQNMGDPELGHPDFRAALLVKYLAHRHPGIFRMRPEGLSNTPVADMAKHLVPPAVKQAVESTTKPEYSQNIQQSPTQPDAPRNATSPAQGEPGIMDRVRAALGNIDFGSLANKGMDAAKGFSPMSNPLHAALLGGGLGMGVGALGSLTSSDKEKRKRWLRNALFGGAMGGIGGAGFGAVMNYGNKLMTDESARQKAEMDKPQTPVLTDHASHVSGTVADTLSGKNLPSMADILKLRDRAGTAIYNAGAPVVDKLQSAYNDPAGFLEAFRRSTVKPFADDPVGGVSAVANKVKGGIGEVGNALSDVANNLDAFKQSLIDTVGKHQGLLVPGGAAAGAMAANALNNRTMARHQQQQMQAAAANPKFTPFVTGKNGVNDKLRAGGHPEVTPQQLAVLGGVQPAKGTPKPPVMKPPQLNAMNTAVKAFNPTAAPPKLRNRALWGVASAALGGLVNSYYTPHLSQAQKQQQAATPPTQ